VQSVNPAPSPATRSELFPARRVVPPPRAGRCHVVDRRHRPRCCRRRRRRSGLSVIKPASSQQPRLLLQSLQTGTILSQVRPSMHAFAQMHVIEIN